MDAAPPATLKNRRLSIIALIVVRQAAIESEKVRVGQTATSARRSLEQSTIAQRRAHSDKLWDDRYVPVICPTCQNVFSR
jgi:hypothetical protein